MFAGACEFGKVPVPHQPILVEPMDKKTVLIAQVLITLMMSFSMSGIMLAINLGFTEEMLSIWMQQFPIAWPIAFIITQFVSAIAFPLAFILRKKIGGPQGPAAH